MRHGEHDESAGVDRYPISICFGTNGDNNAIDIDMHHAGGKWYDD